MWPCGHVTANGNGCALTGNVVPRQSGKNVFDLTINYPAAGCSISGVSVTGMALVIPKGPFGDPQLLMAVSDNTNEGTTWYFGSHSD
jgi:hypothetical protein